MSWSYWGSRRLPTLLTKMKRAIAGVNTASHGTSLLMYDNETPNAPKRQPCPDCGKQCRRVRKEHNETRGWTGVYTCRGCKIFGGTVSWSVSLTREG